MGGRFKNMAGQRFGRLSVVEREGTRSGQAAWRCVCDCGNTLVVMGAKLRYGHTSSCGCLRIDSCRTRRTRHGFSRVDKIRPEYYLWCAMRSRCENPNNKHFQNYGGRGIAVCERWKTFENFFADVGERPSKAHTLERCDNALGYQPGNVKWATRLEQGRNKRNNRRLVFDGQELTLSAWGERTGLKRATIMRRIGLGWSVERALTTPLRKAG
jgi:hypothetical protein